MKLGICVSIVWTGLIVLPLPADLYASRDTEKASRTALLRRATGAEPNANAANPGYRTYVEGMLDINSDPAAKVTNDAYAVPPAPSRPAEDLYVTNLRKDFGGQNSLSGMMENQVKPDRQGGQVDDARYRATEEVYQLERAKQVREFEERQKQSESDALTIRSSLDVSQNNQSQSAAQGLRPSLANNPFYFSESGQLSYAEMRPLIASRMVQLGYTRLEAENLIGNTASPEEALLMLMRKEGFNYGDAVDLVGITPQAPEEE